MSVISYVNQRNYTARDLYALCAAVTTAGGRLRLQATGRSMLPFLPDGTVVVLGAMAQPPPLGAIVLALLDQQVVLHRVLWRWRGRVLLAGDANGRRDGWVAGEQLVGMVIEWQALTRHVRVSRWRRCLMWAWALARHGRRWLVGQRS